MHILVEQLSFSVCLLHQAGSITSGYVCGATNPAAFCTMTEMISGTSFAWDVQICNKRGQVA